MARTIHLEIQASLQDSWLIHRILNFKEDVQRACLRDADATLLDARAVDQALAPLTIEVSSKRALGDLSATIRKAAQNHDVVEIVHVSRLR